MFNTGNLSSIEYFIVNVKDFLMLYGEISGLVIGFIGAIMAAVSISPF